MKGKIITTLAAVLSMYTLPHAITNSYAENTTNQETCVMHEIFGEDMKTHEGEYMLVNNNMRNQYEELYVISNPSVASHLFDATIPIFNSPDCANKYVSTIIRETKEHDKETIEIMTNQKIRGIEKDIGSITSKQREQIVANVIKEYTLPIPKFRPVEITPESIKKYVEHPRFKPY